MVEGLIDAPDDARGVVFDARNQYYRIWMWLLAQVKEAAVNGDHKRWVRCVLALYNHAQTFFTQVQKDEILSDIERARKAFGDMVGNDRRSNEYRAAHAYHERIVEEALYSAERRIYDAMASRNMLLPQQAQDDGTFNIDRLLEESDA